MVCPAKSTPAGEPGNGSDPHANRTPVPAAGAEASDAQPAAIRQLNELVLGADSSTTLMTGLAKLAAELVTAAGRDAGTGTTAGQSPPAIVDPTDRVPVSCGITVRYAKQLVTVSSSDARAELLDETQYQSHVGPCLQSLETAEIIESPDTADETRWPEYLAAALGAGLRCSLSIPLRDGGAAFGALNLYGFSRPRQFGADARKQLELFAGQAGHVLGTALTRLQTVGSASPSDEAVLADMEHALEYRTVINQAVGIVMDDQSCTNMEALAELRRRAEISRRDLHEVAADLVGRVTG